MHADRISMALTRIETAAARISHAAQSGRADSRADGMDDAGAQYQALRREAATALAELDQLIAGLEP